MEKPEPNAMDQEKGTETPDTTSAIEETQNSNEFLTGLKLYLTLGTIVIAGFLITLDASIIVTVCLN